MIRKIMKKLLLLNVISVLIVVVFSFRVRLRLVSSVL